MKELAPEHGLSISRVVPFLIGFPVSRFWVDYDEEADVLYISFARPQEGDGYGNDR